MNTAFKVTEPRVRVHLLVVDNVPPMSLTISRLLQAEGYEVETAASATEVLALAQAVRWDGVVLDIDRPGINGIELYARIQRDYGDGRLPVVFLSCRRHEILSLGLAAAPWAALLQKPCPFAQLLAALRGCLLAR